MYKKIITIIGILLVSISLLAQKNAIYEDMLADYYQGLNYFNKQKYSIAQQLFENILNNTQVSQSTVVPDAQYYHALCAVKLHNNDAENLMLGFINNNKGNKNINQAYLNLAHYFFAKKKYNRVLQYLEPIDIYELNTNDVVQYYFETGYSGFMEEQYKKALPALFEIKDLESPYSSAAEYYYGHIAYIQKNYQTALLSFNSLKNDPNFGIVVPYYIVQVYYLQNKYDSILAYAPKLLANSKPNRYPEIARIIGEAYYHKKDYKNAIYYFEIYRQKATDVSRADIYKLGYAYYKSNKYSEAISIFETISNTSDELTQNAYYHLGYCYIKGNKKEEARGMFYLASELDFDTDIKEDALFNYAKVSFELSFNPYNEAIIALQEYIKNYPQSKRADEFKTYLVDIYLTTKNYKQAYSSISEMDINNHANMQKAYQKITYYLGVHYYNSKDYVLADSLFIQSKKYSVNKILHAKTQYWLAEIAYIQNQDNYKTAINAYKDFVINPDAYELNEYKIAHYNLGYCYFQLKDYANAALWFRKFERKAGNENTKILNDAYLRVADCYFINKNLSEAIAYYEKAIKLNLLPADYAYYQKGVALGRLNKSEEKIQVLKQLEKLYSEQAFGNRRVYEVDAKYEIAGTYFDNSEYKSAQNYYLQIIDKYPKSSYYKQALLKLGLVYEIQDDKEKAIKAFTEVIENYPSTKEANEAFAKISNIYIEKGEEQKIVELSEKLEIDMSQGKQDSLFYFAAENVFIHNKCDSAIKKFNTYLEKYSKGYFNFNAHFYRAECYYGQEKYAEALQDYVYITNQPKNIFTEKSLLKSAEIYFNNQEYKKAALHYYMLEEIAEYPQNIIIAQKGQMDANFLAQNYKPAIENAKKVLNTQKISHYDEISAIAIIARSAFALDSTQLAIQFYDSLYHTADNELKAEAKYYMALILYNAQKYEASKEHIFEQIDKLPDYDEWLAKAFILLSDNFLKQDNLFQAKYMLEGVIEHHEGEELKQIAKERHKKIVELMEQKEKEEQLAKEKQNKNIENINLDTTYIKNDSIIIDTLNTVPPSNHDSIDIKTPENINDSTNHK